MPLVIICGYPCSGKTSFSKQLREYLVKKKECSVHLITDDHERITRNDCYFASAKEKEVRGAMKAAVERLLNSNDVVIADSLNYIKGYRYELYCLVRLLKTVHCVIQCGTNIDTCREWNKSRRDSGQDSYSDDIFTELVQRFEEPDSRKRWDFPFFVWAPESNLSVLDDVSSSLFEQTPKPPKQSTQSQPLSSVDFLQELDQQTKSIIGHLVEMQRTLQPPIEVAIANAREPVQLKQTVTLAELNRSRRQFITYTKLHPVQDTKEIPSLFVQYINKTI